MGFITLQLCSGHGDRVGHLVRGVQMLRSYGQEFELESVSDVVEVQHPDAPTELRVLVSGQTSLDRAGLRQMCQEVQWSLGAATHHKSEPNALVVSPVGGLTPDPAASGPGLSPPATEPYMSEGEFLGACGWGQRIEGQGVEVMGERPGTSGHPV